LELLNENNIRPSKILRGIALTLFSITVLFTIIGGAGTVCIAVGAENYENLKMLAPYKWLYQIFVVVKFAIGFWGLHIIYTLFKGRKKAYRNALIILIIGLLVASAQMITSEILRGKTMPVDIRFYITLITLIFFLIVKHPSIWARVDFTLFRKDKSKVTVAGSTMLIAGLITITTPIWASSSHITSTGFNLVNVLAVPLFYSGIALFLFGVSTLVYSARKVLKQVKLDKVESTT